MKDSNGRVQAINVEPMKDAFGNNAWMAVDDIVNDENDNILVAIRKNDTEIITYYIGVTDRIGIDSKGDSVTVSCIEREDIAPTMIRIVCAIIEKYVLL